MQPQILMNRLFRLFIFSITLLETYTKVLCRREPPNHNGRELMQHFFTCYCSWPMARIRRKIIYIFSDFLGRASGDLPNNYWIRVQRVFAGMVSLDLPPAIYTDLFTSHEPQKYRCQKQYWIIPLGKQDVCTLSELWQVGLHLDVKNKARPKIMNQHIMHQKRISRISVRSCLFH